MTELATYNTIDTMPVKRWFEILKTGHLHHLYVIGSGPTKDELYTLWLDLQQQYFDEFGIDDNFKIRMQKMKRLAELNCELIITGNRFLMNQIAMLEAEFKGQEQTHTASNYRLKDAIEKHRKYHIDLEKTTVIEWGHMVRDYEESGRRAKADSMRQKYAGRG